MLTFFPIDLEIKVEKDPRNVLKLFVKTKLCLKLIINHLSK